MQKKQKNNVNLDAVVVNNTVIDTIVVITYRVVNKVVVVCQFPLIVGGIDSYEALAEGLKE